MVSSPVGTKLAVTGDVIRQTPNATATAPLWTPRTGTVTPRKARALGGRDVLSITSEGRLTVGSVVSSAARADAQAVRDERLHDGNLTRGGDETRP